MVGAARKKLVGRYEVGQTIGQGTFAKVKFVVEAETGAAVAMMVVDKATIMMHQVLINNGYDGSAADIWSCGVILYVLMDGYLPFEENDLSTLYDKITATDFSCPCWFSLGAKSLVQRILDPYPKTVSVGTSFQDEHMNWVLMCCSIPDWFTEKYTLYFIRENGRPVQACISLGIL